YDHGTLVPEYSYSYVERVAEKDIAPAFELGVMYHYKKLNVIAGVTYLTPMNDDYNYTDSYRDYESDNVYTDYHYWNIDGKNSGNLGVFVSIGLHI
ncbi:MAG: hypothetical protein K2L90_01085, partial [Muribaculaceae bacterium]|nr:hypothetical protein [Muribaculaceae bacterium]